MRVLIIDPDEARAALVAQGLDGVEPLDEPQDVVALVHGNLVNGAANMYHTSDLLISCYDDR